MARQDERREPTESPSGAPPPLTLSPKDIAAMIRLDAIWKHFGGPPSSEVFVEFGISVDEFFRRLERIARTESGRAARHDQANAGETASTIISRHRWHPDDRTDLTEEVHPHPVKGTAGGQYANRSNRDRRLAPTPDVPTE
nr:hypothetical protein JVH1_6836 [Rhodococcus sp. JVH1]